MEIKYICTYWGQEETSVKDFFLKLLHEGYEGVEISLPASQQFVSDFQFELKEIRQRHPSFIFIAQQVLSTRRETVSEYILRMNSLLRYLVTLQPDAINSHTGKDYFSFEDNCKIIEAAENISRDSGIPIFHETHRGRFTFHLKSVLPYMDRFPDLKLTADFSHWCTVSESLLLDQEELLTSIIANIYHLHARVGYAHSPQVNNPFAPEWKAALDVHMDWWKNILTTRSRAGDAHFTICPEFGPVPYMPTTPFTQIPLANQWSINAQLKKHMQDEFG